jgi:hypothetical protein
VTDSDKLTRREELLDVLKITGNRGSNEIPHNNSFF